jgi:TonB-dependent SusC/RagA subfamily outer membrane receptor
MIMFISYVIRGKKWAFLCSFILFATFSYSQQNYTLQGKITSTDGEPLIGAAIELLDLHTGTTSDLDGNYSVTFAGVPGPFPLRFSYTGFANDERVIELGSLNVINLDIQLTTDILRLTEIVVTGTGALTEKRQLGNSIATMDNKEIAGAGSVDLTGALSGKMAGIQVTQNSGDPAGGVSVRLRSASTVNGSSDPLYIIDGVIVNNRSTNVLNITSVVQNRLADVNPQDIERIEVIKGAAAAAIYGSRASNGVVQIFTKTVNATRYDYQDMVFVNSIGTDNYLSISGGSESTRYFSSFSYMNNEGIMKGTSFDRVAGRVRIDHILNKWASISAGSYVARSHSNDLPNGGYGFGVLQTILFTNNKVNPAKDENGDYPTMTFYPNILEYIETFDYQQFNNRSISDIQLKLNPLSGMNINLNVGYDHANSRGTSYSPIGTTTATNGRARTSTIGRTQLNTDLNGSYRFDISSELTSTTGAGYTLQYDRNTLSTISGSTLALGVQTTDGAGTISTDELRSEVSIWGGYVQQTFGFQDKLFLTGALRLDGSSVFGQDERSQFYPKVSASYILSDESFWINSLGDVLESFKLRAAWGRAGNLTAIGPFDVLTNYGGVSIGGNAGLISPSTIGNPGLKPERQTELEFGIDMTFLQNRLGIELTYYSQDIEDLLLQRTLAPSTGASSRIENIGTMTNDGFEALVSATPVQSNNFRWNVMATFSSNKNEVNGVEGEEISIGNFNFSKARNGEPLGVFRQGFYARNPDGSLLLTSSGVPQREKGSYDTNGNPVPQR